MHRRATLFAKTIKCICTTYMAMDECQGACSCLSKAQSAPPNVADIVVSKLRGNQRAAMFCGGLKRVTLQKVHMRALLGSQS